MLPHVSAQPLAYLYLSQIPYTGLDLGPVGTVIYWIVLITFALVLTYFVFFNIVPFVNTQARNFGSRVLAVLNIPEPEPIRITEARVDPIVSPRIMPSITERKIPEAPHGYSSYDGFKSFARKNTLSIEDIVKGLSREHSAVTVQHKIEQKPNVEPIYENVEPIYENVESITNGKAMEVGDIPASVRGFAAALVEGDRAAVFAGLRQQIRGGDAPEHFISQIAFLLDDVYRSRIDGSACDANIARLTARLSTPTLEKLVASLATAIDSSYSSGVTGAKMSLIRALSILGA